MFDPLRNPCSYDDEPVPQFATAADIALAEALRRQLELRYFGSGSGSPLASAAANEDGTR
jgi:hypothetical protein